MNPFRSFVSALRSTPEALILLPLIAVSAGLAARVGTLPGEGYPVLGPVVECLAWSLLYLGLGLAYTSAHFAERESGRPVLRRIGLALLLALISAHLCHRLYYLKRLVPLALALFWCAALLPRETRTLVRSASAASALTPLPQLALLLAISAILVSLADLAFESCAPSEIARVTRDRHRGDRAEPARQSRP